MPIFQEDIARRESAADVSMSSPSAAAQKRSDEPLIGRDLERRSSEESIRTDLCDGPVSDETRSTNLEDGLFTGCSDRAELIQRLKRGESPTWISNRHAGTRSPFNSASRRLAGEQSDSVWGQRPATPIRRLQSPQEPAGDSPSLLPPPTITPEKGTLDSDDERRLRDGMSIERPRSALHSGDFTQENTPTHRRTTDGRRSDHDRTANYRGRHEESWMATSPPRDFTPFHFERMQRAEEPHPVSFSLSSSLSSTNFFYQPPTSPLVQSESHEDIDLANPMDGIDIGSTYARSARRHTMMSGSPASYSFASSNRLPVPPPSLRQERTFPYQAHQPRRSLASTPTFFHNGTSPQTPGFLRSRRPSYSSDSSPLQHASMVGSYEESILRGRMSTTPSKPLDFVAQIGVLGLGKCKSSLRCPAHVTLPFPAVFYSYASSSHGRSKTEDGPSPYVGQVDLENGLPNQEEEARSKRKAQSRALERQAVDDLQVKDEPMADHAVRDPRRSQKPKRRSGSPKAPPGGSYRIPEKGQIQIIIKNPNKTAVKLFLVPYDLAGMEPGTKTFIRQRSYSAGPIIDNLPELKDTSSASRPTLRYLVHLHICCPSRGRFYLYKSIRVVFANRVPDGKERLQNEITLPEPRFTAYKPIRVMHPPIAASTGPGASLAAEKAFRRRSSGFYMGATGQNFGSADGILPDTPIPQQRFSYSGTPSRHVPVEAVPLRLPQKASSNAVNQIYDNIHSNTNIWSSPGSRHPMEPESSQISGFSVSMSQLDRYDKLNKGDVGYGGNPFSNLINGRPGTAEGLLSQRLRTLGVEADAQSSHEPNDMEQ
ncbi:hypothetical protein BJ166DRAFT_311827 [Pestalotiopsis sp. NC0098]|nr:hypothetical protein BJ166DRAFT_311827 [Pestalotiopsis sp. NC0098]